MEPSSYDPAKVYITGIEVEDLFGHYSYDIPSGDQTFDPDLGILYGGNGTGKTTILKLVHHMISGGRRRGHKSYIARTPFRSIALHFSNGNELVAHRKDSEAGSFTMRLSHPQRKSMSADFIVIGGRIPTDKTELSDAQDSLVAQAAEHIPLASYFLGDDRRLDSDVFPNQDDDGESLYIRMRRYERRGFDPASVEIGQPSQLELAFERAQHWARTQALSGANIGAQNANSIYREVLEQLSFESDQQLSEDEEKADPPSLYDELSRLAERSRDHSRFGLTTSFDHEGMSSVIESARRERRNLMIRVLRPYVDGIKARLDAQDELYETLKVFADTVNAFLFDKSISFDVRGAGILVTTSSGIELPPDRLSSGERQIITQLCNILFARQHPSLVLIDEPELSLNVAWQRNLVPALLGCAEGSAIQFLLATHSIELLSHHRERVLPLRPVGS